MVSADDSSIWSTQPSGALFKKEKDLGEYIFEVFIKSFGENSFQRSITECRMIASKIIENGI